MAMAVAWLLTAGAAVAQPEPTIIPDWPEDAPRAPRPFVPLANQPNPDVPLPQDALLVPTLENIMANREDMQVALVAVDLGQDNDNPYWQMSQTALTVFLNKLATLKQQPVPEDAIWPQLPKPDPRYNGLLVLLQTKEGRRFVPFRVFMGQLGLGPSSPLAKDPGRGLEYWLFGTARVRRDQLIGANVLPVYTFAQCKVLGQRVIETTPRQCLLANNNLLLETSEPPTLASAQMTTFADCLRGGTGLIYTFPRRCVAAGGRVFTEPPQIYDSTKPLPQDAPVRKPNAKRLLPNPVSPTVVTPTTLQPLVPVSPSAPVSPAAPPPPLAKMGEGLLQTIPSAPTWRQLGGSR
ncbi:MAG: hypothetical protein INF43_00100 [Alphaproteobacteria bacterium]|nr:hypothetical protein [Alphaproteobacteria bacterium]